MRRPVERALSCFQHVISGAFCGMRPNVLPVDEGELKPWTFKEFKWPGTTLDKYVCPKHGETALAYPCECMLGLRAEDLHRLLDILEPLVRHYAALGSKRFEFDESVPKKVVEALEQTHDYAAWLRLRRMI